MTLDETRRVRTAHVAGAYLLTKPSQDLAKGVLTASACLADLAPDCWAIEWVSATDDERRERAARLGLRAADVPVLVRWVTDRFDDAFLWPNVFSDVSHAREFHRRFRPKDVHLIGIGLPVDLVDTFLALSAPPPPQPGYAPVGATGIHQMLHRKEPLAAGGSRRGHEVLGYDDAGQFHSFRCNHLEVELELTLNEWGLVDDVGAARECAAHASLPSVGACARAWHPWLVEEYPL